MKRTSLLLTILALEIFSTDTLAASVNEQNMTAQPQGNVQSVPNPNPPIRQRPNTSMPQGNTMNTPEQPMTVVDQGGSLKAIPRTSPNQNVILPANPTQTNNMNQQTGTRPIGAASPVTGGAPPSTTNTGVPQSAGTNLPLNQPAGPITARPPGNSGVTANQNQTSTPEVMRGPNATSTQAIQAPNQPIQAPNQPFGVPNQVPGTTVNQGVQPAQQRPNTNVNQGVQPLQQVPNTNVNQGMQPAPAQPTNPTVATPPSTR